jgi:hypothetical protein
MMEGPGADSEEKRVLASDLDTVMVDSLKALDLSRPIREADITTFRLGYFQSASLTRYDATPQPGRGNETARVYRRFRWCGGLAVG